MIYHADGVSYHKWENVGQDSVAGTATHYGLGIPGFKFQCGRSFSDSSRLAQMPNQPLEQWLMGLFLGSKAARVWH